MKRILLSILIVFIVAPFAYGGDVLFGGGGGTGSGITALTTDVTASGTGSVAATIAAKAVTLAKMNDLAANSMIGNNTVSPATPIALTSAQIKTFLGYYTSGDTVSLGPITLPAGTATVGTAPIYFASGTNLTICADGAEEYDGTSRTHCVGTARKIYLTNDLSNISAASAVTGILITGYSSGAGTVAATDTILQAINKLNGNQVASNPVVTIANGGTLSSLNGYNVTSGATTWTLPATATALGQQHCFRQQDAATNAISITPPTSSYVEASDGSAYCTVSHAIKSGGASGDSICYVSIDSTHWMAFGGARGTWTCQ